MQIETLHTLSVLIFACIYFCELKKLYFASTYFLQLASFWKFRVYINFSPIEKRTRKIKGYAANFQWKGRQVTMEKLLLLIDSEKSWINQHFFAYFWGEFISVKYEFFASLACIYFHKRCLKEDFACC